MSAKHWLTGQHLRCSSRQMQAANVTSIMALTVSNALMACPKLLLSRVAAKQIDAACTLNRLKADNFLLTVPCLVVIFTACTMRTQRMHITPSRLTALAVGKVGQGIA